MSTLPPHPTNSTSQPATIAIVDFGGQYVQLIARRTREHQVHSVIVPPDVSPQQLRALNVVGMIWSGGPASVYVDRAPRCGDDLLDLGVPILGICYGMQLLCEMLGCNVRAGSTREFGRAEITITASDPLLHHVPEKSYVWMSHGDLVTDLSSEFVPLARTVTCPYAAVRHRTKTIYGVQFHPEVAHSPYGSQIIRNFLYEICHCAGDWQVAHVVDKIVQDIRVQVGDRDRVICGLSGGVDSSVTASLVHRAIGERLACILVDNGFMRSGEVELVERTFRQHFHIDLKIVDASQRFLSRLRGITDPNEKRRIIGHEFIDVFKSAAAQFRDARFLAQGTLYPDVIESGSGLAGHTAGIKLHHNVGGLPAELGFELIEPLRDLFKDEARRVGEYLGLPEEVIWRHPFPGPGLAVRVVGEVTLDRLSILRLADRIILEEITSAGAHRKVAQAFGVLLPLSTVGIMGDQRSYQGQHVVAIRVVESEDFMTADWSRLDHEILATMAARIMNEVPGVNRVVYDISTKPPATIEWE